MTTPESGTGRSPLEQLLWDHHDVYWHYAERRKAAEQFTAATAAIEVINSTLPLATHRLVAESHFSHPTKVYERDNQGNYRLRSTIYTSGKGYSFIGDQLEVIDGELVVIDSELGGGISIEGPFKVESLEDIQRWRKDQDYAQFLDMIARTEPQEDAYYDCLYY